MQSLPATDAGACGAEPSGPRGGLQHGRAGGAVRSRQLQVDAGNDESPLQGPLLLGRSIVTAAHVACALDARGAAWSAEGERLGHSFSRVWWPCVDEGGGGAVSAQDFSTAFTSLIQVASPSPRPACLGYPPLHSHESNKAPTQPCVPRSPAARRQVRSARSLTHALQSGAPEGSLHPVPYLPPLSCRPRVSGARSADSLPLDGA